MRMKPEKSFNLSLKDKSNKLAAKTVWFYKSGDSQLQVYIFTDFVNLL